VKKVAKLLLIGLLMFGLVFTAVGCNKEAAPDKTADQSQQQAQDNAKKPVLRVGSETQYAPFEMVENGEYVGFDMDLIRAIGAAEGYDVKIESMGFKALIPAVMADKIDCAVSAMSITDERKQSIDFSNPYFQAGLVIAVQEKTQGISSRDDLKGKKLAAEKGTTGAAASEKIKELDPKTEVRIFDTVGAAFMELEKGSVDAVINDMPVTAYYISKEGKGKVKMVGDVFQADDQYGIAIKKGNTKILNAINDGLAKVKANGEYDKIYKKWFGDQK
jgi:polar amino acid transport system substrate-binding protein